MNKRVGTYASRLGETVQVWSFGSESEIKNLDKMIKIDAYIVYWGNYNISPKTSNNLSPTSDWIIKIQPKHFLSRIS